MIKQYSLFLIIFSIVSCSLISQEKKSQKEEYTIEDKGENFLLIRESGLDQTKQRSVVKQKIFPWNDHRQKVEQSIVISKKDLFIPEISEFIIWLEGEKYYSRAQINWKRRQVEYFLKSPVEMWNGSSLFKFPKNLKVLCFFSQIVECAEGLGFLKKAIAYDRGEMNFHVLMEGYPFLNDQYVHFTKDVFHEAKLVYKGSSKENHAKFQLELADHVIMYFLTRQDYKIIKFFWIAQNITILLKDKKNREIL